MANTSILAAFERMWQHTVALLSNKSDTDHIHDDRYYTESEIDTKLEGKANSSHNHAASEITSGTLSSDRLPTVPITKGGTGATTAAAALTNLGITATASELNYVDGVTSNIQTQLNGKAASSHNHSASDITSGTLSIARGGTGATTESAVRTNLSVYSKAETESYVSNQLSSIDGGTW